MSFYRKITLLLSLSILFSVMAIAQKMSFTSQVSGSTVGIREQFRVTFTISNPTEALDFMEPLLKDFMIIEGPRQSNSTTFVSIYGRNEEQLTVSYSYVLQPRRLGTMVIGAAGIRTQSGQQLSTKPIQIKVTAQNQGGNRDDAFTDDIDKQMAETMRRRQQMLQQLFEEPEEPQPLPIDDIKGLTAEHLDENIFIRAEVDQKNPYVGQQVNVVYKLYTRLKMSMSPTAFPALNGFWTQDIKLPPDSPPVQENYNGKRYNVFVLKKAALFPQEAGTLALDQAKAQGKVEVAEYIGANRYMPTWVDVSLESPIVPITVKPLPAPNKPADFSGGLGEFRIATNLSNRKFSTDDVVQLVLTVAGNGNIGLISAPQLALPTGLSVIDPEVKDSIVDIMPKLLGAKQFIYQISADSAGTYTIPSMRFSYFDISTNQYKVLHTDSFQVSVSKGTKPKIVKGDAIDQMNDIHGLMSSNPSFNGSSVPLWRRGFYWGLYLLTGLVLGLLLWRQHRKRYKEQHADVFKQKTANKEAWKRLATARNAIQHSKHTVFYEEVSKAVWLYLSDKLGISLSELSKENVAQKLRFKQIEENLIEQTLALITECEMALYSPVGGQQQKQQTLEEAVRIIGIFENQFKKK